MCFSFKPGNVRAECCDIIKYSYALKRPMAAFKAQNKRKKGQIWLRSVDKTRFTDLKN